MRGGRGEGVRRWNRGKVEKREGENSRRERMRESRGQGEEGRDGRKKGLHHGVVSQCE